jgi:H/ACA ribonucleoprotein complex subunit 4
MKRIEPSWLIKRDLMTKAEEETDIRFGNDPYKRQISDYIKFGLINLDKTSGPSSHEVTAWLKVILGLKKAGHGGTLEGFTPRKSQGDWNFTNSS